MSSKRSGGGAGIPNGDSNDVEAGIPPTVQQQHPPKSKAKRRPSRQEMQNTIRARALSNGSTFGAFYQNDPPPPKGREKTKAGGAAGGGDLKPHTGMRKRRSSKRNTGQQGGTTTPPLRPPPVISSAPPPYQVPNNNTGSDLGDLASMAISGMDDIDFADIMGSAPPPNRSRRAPQQQQQVPATATAASTSSAPPARRIPRPIPQSNGGSSQLPTIVDDSEAHHLADAIMPNSTNLSDGSTPEYARATQNYDMYGGGGYRSSSNNNRMSTNTIDSLRVSEMSTGLAEDVAGMLTNLDRDNSMFLSEVDGGRFDQQSNRTSLLGSSIIDKQSSGSLYTQQQVNRSPIANQQQQFPINSSHHVKAPSQQEEIANFAAMLHADYGAADEVQSSHPLKSQGPPAPLLKPPRPPVPPQKQPFVATASSEDDDDITNDNEDDYLDESIVEERQSRFLDRLDPTNWLTKDVEFDDDGIMHFPASAKWTIAGFVRGFFYNPISPEFSSLQQFTWAVVLGIVMGFFTAFWKSIIEHSVDFMWETVPEALLEIGFFTDLDGVFPLYHYMWMCPAFWGGLLSYIFVILPIPIPGQNEWIQNVHTRGVQDSDTFLHLFVLATLAMASGLSLGPELPLVLTASMIGSWLAIQCKQSVLQARVMNITCASAAIGGFFGFPMAGALFVMELPHRMGLQYFEALSPATIASIVAVLCNRLVTNNDVTGYYSYPFLTTSLPSEIFTSAIVFGLYGAFVGTAYAKIVIYFKGLVHDFFHAPHDDHNDDGEDADHGEDNSTDDSTPEKTPLLNKSSSGKKKNEAPPPELPFYEKVIKSAQKYFCCVIPYEPARAAASGVVAGAIVGCICMYVPHTMFWGEAQLQTLIDKGRTPLPVFGAGDEPTAALTAKGYCMIDPTDAAAVRAGFSLGCSFVISVAKIVATGLSLGTGIVAGQFWGPLFVGCSASHFLTDVTRLLSDYTGFGGQLAAYPCVTILCTMGATHVVTFRAHTAIMLILTLTISTFDPEDDSGNNAGVAGDYSAVFPLLVVSVFVSLMISRQTVFYKEQRSRGDLMALPEVLCEPGKEGMPMVLDYEGGDIYDNDSTGDYSSEGGYLSDADVASMNQRSSGENSRRQMRGPELTQVEIEKQFIAKAGTMGRASPPASEAGGVSSRGRVDSSGNGPRSRGPSPLPPRPDDRRTISSEIPPSPSRSRVNSSGDSAAASRPGELSSSRLDELLSKPLDNQRPQKAMHRRIQSAPNVDFGVNKRFQKQRSNISSEKSLGGDSSGVGNGAVAGYGRHTRSDSFGSQASGKVTRIATVGHLTVEQPSLMDQARLRSATTVIVESRHVRQGSMPSRIPRGRHSRQNSASSLGLHSRQNSASSAGLSSGGPPPSVAAAVPSGVPSSEVERAYSSAVNRQYHEDRTTDDGSARGNN